MDSGEPTTLSAKNIRITGDGTRMGTQVRDAETGEPIPYVERIEITIDARLDAPLVKLFYLLHINDELQKHEATIGLAEIGLTLQTAKHVVSVFHPKDTESTEA